LIAHAARLAACARSHSPWRGFYVALPKAWVLENKLESGYVVIEPESGGARERKNFLRSYPLRALPIAAQLKLIEHY